MSPLSRLDIKMPYRASRFYGVELPSLCSIGLDLDGAEKPVTIYHWESRICGTEQPFPLDPAVSTQWCRETIAILAGRLGFNGTKQPSKQLLSVST